jgi:hypothetical protein
MFIKGAASSNTRLPAHGNEYGNRMLLLHLSTGRCSGHLRVRGSFADLGQATERPEISLKWR